MADDKKQQGPPWQEQMRYLPYHPRDFDPAVQLVEHPRDENGKEAPLDPNNWEAPEPYVMFDRHVDGVHEVERVAVPEKAHARLQRLVDGGQLRAEQLSQLPLRELVPELAGHPVVAHSVNSGAAAFVLPPDSAVQDSTAKGGK